MTTPRHEMTVRVVSLTSREAGDARVGGTIAERLALVSTLSAQLWSRTKRPLPSYTRATLPVEISSLQCQSPRAPDDG